MKKDIAILVSFLLAVQCVFAGIEFVGADGVATTYDAGSGTLSMIDNVAVIVEYDDNSQITFNNASLSLITYYDSGMFFTGGTFVFTDESDSSEILSGSVLSVQFEEVFGYLVGSGQAEVLVSNLSGFPLGMSDIVSVTFNLAPAFTDFSQDYTGDSKVNFVVPEPATLGLLGLASVALLRRKK